MRLLDVNTAIKGAFLSLQRGEQACVNFRLHDLLLKPGTILLGLWLGRGGIEEIDSVQQAASFSVEAPPVSLKHSETFPVHTSADLITRFNLAPWMARARPQHQYEEESSH